MSSLSKTISSFQRCLCANELLRQLSWLGQITQHMKFRESLNPLTINTLNPLLTTFLHCGEVGCGAGSTGRTGSHQLLEALVDVGWSGNLDGTQNILIDVGATFHRFLGRESHYNYVHMYNSYYYLGELRLGGIILSLRCMVPAGKSKCPGKPRVHEFGPGEPRAWGNRE